MFLLLKDAATYLIRYSPYTVCVHLSQVNFPVNKLNLIGLVFWYLFHLGVFGFSLVMHSCLLSHACDSLDFIVF